MTIELAGEQRTFNKDVLRSVVFLDGIAETLREPDGMRNAVLYRGVRESAGSILTSAARLCPASVPGEAGPDFEVMLHPLGRGRNGTGISDGSVFVSLSVLPCPGSLEGMVDALPRIGHIIAHEHKHVLDWQRTGQLTGAVGNRMHDGDSKYHNHPGEVMAWTHHLVVDHLTTLIGEMASGQATADDLLADHDGGRLLDRLLQTLPDRFTAALTQANTRLVGSLLGGFSHSCMRTVLTGMRDATPSRNARGSYGGR